MKPKLPHLKYNTRKIKQTFILPPSYRCFQLDLLLLKRNNIVMFSQTHLWNRQRSHLKTHSSCFLTACLFYLRYHFYFYFLHEDYPYQFNSKEPIKLSKMLTPPTHPTPLFVCLKFELACQFCFVIICASKSTKKKEPKLRNGFSFSFTLD